LCFIQGEEINCEVKKKRSRRSKKKRIVDQSKVTLDQSPPEGSKVVAQQVVAEVNSHPKHSVELGNDNKAIAEIIVESSTQTPFRKIAKVLCFINNNLNILVNFILITINSRLFSLKSKDTHVAPLGNCDRGLMVNQHLLQNGFCSHRY
jgi:hypothetical protein